MSWNTFQPLQNLLNDTFIILNANIRSSVKVSANITFIVTLNYFLSGGI